MEGNQVLFAGFGGQGVLSMGQFLAHAALSTGERLLVPSYGANARWTANCLVAKEEIVRPNWKPFNGSCPIALPDKFEPKIKANGTWSKHFPGWPATGAGHLEILELPMNKLAEKLATQKA